MFVLQVNAAGKGLARNTWGGVGLDNGDEAAVSSDGTIALGATTESTPPFTFAGCPRQLKKLHGAVAAPDVPLAAATGALADSAGTVARIRGDARRTSAIWRFPATWRPAGCRRADDLDAGMAAA